MIPLVLILFAAASTPDMQKVTRHPQLWALLLWAGSHIPINGDAVSVMMFGVLALFVLINQPLIDTKIRREDRERWAEKFAGTSAILFLDALQGKGRPNLKEIGFAHIGVALVLMLYLVILFAHEQAIGFSALPG